MKKKVGLGIVAILMIAGAVVFANNHSANQNENNCPDRPGCICSKPNTEKAVKTPVAKTKTECTNTPDCVCK